MADMSGLTEAERLKIKWLKASDAIVRTVNTDHDGNVHVLLKWPKEYVEAHQNGPVEESENG